MQNKQTVIFTNGGGTNSLLLVKMTKILRGKERK